MLLIVVIIFMHITLLRGKKVLVGRIRNKGGWEGSTGAGAGQIRLLISNACKGRINSSSATNAPDAQEPPTLPPCDTLC